MKKQKQMALVQEIWRRESSGLIDESKHLTECVKAKTHLTFEWRGKADVMRQAATAFLIR